MTRRVEGVLRQFRQMNGQASISDIQPLMPATFSASKGNDLPILRLAPGPILPRRIPALIWSHPQFVYPGFSFKVLVLSMLVYHSPFNWGTTEERRWQG